MYPLFESIKIEDGIIFNIDYHQNRMAKLSDLQLMPYLSQVVVPSTGSHKLRIVYTKDQFVGFTITPYIYRTIRKLALCLDNHIHYRAKSQDRRAIDLLFAQRGQCDDVLIIKNGMVTDTSFCNIVLLDGNIDINPSGNWVTPSTPLLEGTCRARLLKQGIITATEIRLEDLSRYNKFMLINAFMDFDLSRAQPLSFPLESGITNAR